MYDVAWPSTAKIAGFSLTVEAHSRGGGRQGVFDKGAGARWHGSLSVTAAAPADGFAFRAFLHSLRGRAGSFLLRLPVKVPAIALPADTFPRGDGRTHYTDGFAFSDGTAYADAYTGGDAYTTAGALASAASARASEIAVDAPLAASVHCVVGAFLTVGTFPGPAQLVRVVAINATTLTVRPALRTAFAAGTVVTAGKVTARFRLDDDETPVVPMLGRQALPVELNIAEVY